MDLNYINWNVQPEIFRVGNFAIRWYGLLFAVAFIIGYNITKKMLKREGVPKKVLDTGTLYLLVGIIAGSRLAHCFFYEPVYYFNNPIKILFIWQGGLSSHGMVIGVLIAFWIFSIRSKRSWLWMVDRLAIVLTLAGVFVRLGNLMNSEAFGIETTLPWGFIFLRRGETIPRHPTQIYEAVCYLIIFSILYFIYLKKWEQLKNGFLLGLALVTVFPARFIIEFIKEPMVDFDKISTLNTGQLLSIPFIIFGVYLLVRKETGSICYGLFFKLNKS